MATAVTIDAAILLRPSSDATRMMPPSRRCRGEPFGTVAASDVPSLLAEYPDAQFVFGLVVGRTKDMAAAASDGAVWLVDPADDPQTPPPNLYASMEKFNKADK